MLEIDQNADQGDNIHRGIWVIIQEEKLIKWRRLLLYY